MGKLMLLFMGKREFAMTQFLRNWVKRVKFPGGKQRRVSRRQCFVLPSVKTQFSCLSKWWEWSVGHKTFANGRSQSNLQQTRTRFAHWSNYIFSISSIILFKEEISPRNNRGRARARLLPRSSAEVGRRRYLEPITLRSSVAQSRVE